jgi:signal transduction histidine kinase
VRDAVVAAAIAAAYSLLVGGLGALAVPVMRRRSFGAALGAAVVTSLLAVVVAVVGTAAGMFVASYDVTVVVVACAVAAVTGLAVTGLLARQVAGGAEELRSAVRDFARRGTFTAPRQPAPELAALSAELDRTLDELKAVQRARRELVAGLSHDLRSPLAGIRAMAEALEDGVAPDPQRYHETIRRDAERLTAMVDDLVELALRDRDPAPRPDLAAVPLTALAADAVTAAEAVAAEAGVRVHTSGPAVAAVGDRDALLRVAGNLLHNAIRHTPAGGSVALSVNSDGPEAVLSVADGCGGIPAEHLSRVFDTGWRASPARTPDGGAGLGLAIVRAVVQAHGGSVAVRNVPGGCRFEIRLPRAAQGVTGSAARTS